MIKSKSLIHGLTAMRNHGANASAAPVILASATHGALVLGLNESTLWQTARLQVFANDVFIRLNLDTVSALCAQILRL